MLDYIMHAGGENTQETVHACFKINIDNLWALFKAHHSQCFQIIIILTGTSACTVISTAISSATPLNRHPWYNGQ